MANVQYTENMTEEQLDAMAGSETLRYQATSFGATRNNKVHLYLIIFCFCFFIYNLISKSKFFNPFIPKHILLFTKSLCQNAW